MAKKENKPDFYTTPKRDFEQDEIINGDYVRFGMDISSDFRATIEVLQKAGKIMYASKANRSDELFTKDACNAKDVNYEFGKRDWQRIDLSESNAIPKELLDFAKNCITKQQKLDDMLVEMYGHSIIGQMYHGKKKYNPCPNIEKMLT